MTEKVSFKRGPYALRRIPDMMGDSGQMLNSIDPKTGLPVGENGDVIVGCRLQCGSTYARSYQFQDWWMCTVIKKIVEQHDGYAVVETESGNEYYVGETKKVTHAILQKAG